MTLNLTVVKIIVGGVVSFLACLVVLLAGVEVLRGGPQGQGQVITLIGVVGTLVSIAASLLVTGAVAGAAAQIQGDVNGHLAQHIGHTDDQVRQLVRQELAGQPPEIEQVSPPPPATPGGSAT